MVGLQLLERRSAEPQVAGTSKAQVAGTSGPFPGEVARAETVGLPRTVAREGLLARAGTTAVRGPLVPVARAAGSACRASEPSTRPL